MFFFGIFGIEPKEKFIKDINNKTCKGCGTFTAYKLFKQYMVFHFFFIPIIKWRETYFLVCRNCGDVFEIPKEKGKSLEKGENISIDDCEMKKVYESNARGEVVCSSCGAIVDNSFKFCPNCGAKLRN